ncbi:hypothetical protein D3C80_1694600 [compost metagenome]
MNANASQVGVGSFGFLVAEAFVPVTAFCANVAPAVNSIASAQASLAGGQAA